MQRFKSGYGQYNVLDHPHSVLMLTLDVGKADGLKSSA